MIKTILFPYDCESFVYINNQDLLREMEIKEVATFGGWGYVGEDLNNGILIVKDIRECDLVEYEAIWIVESRNNVDFQKDILPVIKSAVQNRLKVICSKKLNVEEKSMICEAVPKEQLQFFNGEKRMFLKTTSELYDIDIPVILIIGLCQNTNKFDIQLGLRRKFVENEYVISQIGTRYESLAFGFHSWFEKLDMLEDGQQILYINNYIKQLECTEGSDAIIIGIPGESMPYSKKTGWNFGMLVLKVIQAIRPDYTILTIPYTEDIKEVAGEWKNNVEKRIGVPIDIVNISDRCIFCGDEQRIKETDYLKLNDRFMRRIKKEIGNSDFLVCSIEEDMTRMYEKIINKLSEENTLVTV